MGIQGMGRKGAMRRAVILAGLLVVFGVSAHAQDSRPATKLTQDPRLDPSADSRVTLHVKATPLVDVVNYLRARSGVNLVVADGAEGSITVDLDQVPWRLALETVVEQAGCVLVDKAANLIRVEKPPRVTFEFAGADVRVVVDSIAKLAGASVVVAPEVEGTVYLRVNNVPWRTALDTVVKSLGFTVVEDAWGILRVVHPSKLEAQMGMKVFNLRYLRPPSPYVPKIKTEYAEGQAKAPTQDPEKDFPLIKALRSVLSKGGSLEYVSRTNILLIKDTEPVLAQVGRLLQEMDVEPAQIFVDVKFVTTTNTDALTYGFDITDQGFQAGLTGGAIPTRLPFNLGGGGWNSSFTANENGRTPGLNDADTLAATTFGTLDFTKATFTLNMLKKDDRSRIVQAPKLMALDNQEATIFVGRTIRYAETEAQAAQSGGLTFSIREAKGSPVQTGFQLYMIPHVIPGTDKVMMTLIPEAEQLIGRSSDPNLQGFQIFTSGEGTPNEVSIALPQIASSTMVSTLMLQSGHTAVIGGMVTETETERINKFPVLGDIPVLDFFFKSKSRAKSNEALLIFITPRILRDSDDLERIVRSEDLLRQKQIEAENERIFGGAEGLVPMGPPQTDSEKKAGG